MEVRINSRVFTSVIALLALTACGGGGDGADATGDTQPTPTTRGADSTTATAAPDTKPTTASTTAAGREGTDFCDTVGAEMLATDDVDVRDVEAFEERSRENLALFEDLRGIVPPELDDFYDTLLEANREWLTLLEDYDWNVMTIPDDEPRFWRMGEEDVLEASEAILEYCGIDLSADEPSDPGPQGDLEALMPPGAGDELASSPVLMVESSASYLELVAYYTDLLEREPVSESKEGNDRSATFVAQYNGTQVAVFIEASAGEVVVVSISTG